MIYEGLVVFRGGKAKSFISDDIVQNSKQSDTKNTEKNDRTSDTNSLAYPVFFIRLLGGFW